MNYSLAKQLKDAGFPQGPYQKIFDDIKEHPERTAAYLREFAVTTIDNLAYRPTLSELIEACGQKLHSLRRGSWAGSPIGWMASEDWWDRESFCPRPKEPVGVGSTPTEAVARLWLALNKKI